MLAIVFSDPLPERVKTQNLVDRANRNPEVWRCRSGVAIFFKDLSHRENAPKSAPKRAPNMFSPKFQCLFVCSENSKKSTPNATEEQPSKTCNQKIHHGTKQDRVCRCGRAGSFSTCPFDKQKIRSGSKTCYSTKNFSGVHFPKYVIPMSTRKFPRIIFFQLGDVNLH